MTTLSDKIADILAYHEFHFKIVDGKTDDGPLHCDCEQWQDDTCAQFENHRAHQAEMLAPLIREAQAEALEAAAFDLPAGMSRKGFYAWLRTHAASIRESS